MTKEFEEAIAHFKAEFGNTNHMKALEMLKKLRSKESLLAEKKKNQAIIKKAIQEVEQDERQILFLMKS